MYSDCVSCFALVDILARAARHGHSRLRPKVIIAAAIICGWKTPMKTNRSAPAQTSTRVAFFILRFYRESKAHSLYELRVFLNCRLSVWAQARPERYRAVG